jgi:hypothetical protein
MGAVCILCPVLAVFLEPLRAFLGSIDKACVLVEAAIMSAKAGGAASNAAASTLRYCFIADILSVMSLAGGWSLWKCNAAR